MLGDASKTEIIRARLAIYRLVDSQFEKIQASKDPVDEFPVPPGAPSAWPRVYGKFIYLLLNSSVVSNMGVEKVEIFLWIIDPELPDVLLYTRKDPLLYHSDPLQCLSVEESVPLDMVQHTGPINAIRAGSIVSIEYSGAATIYRLLKHYAEALAPYDINHKTEPCFDLPRQITGAVSPIDMRNDCVYEWDAYDRSKATGPLKAPLHDVSKAQAVQGVNIHTDKDFEDWMATVVDDPQNYPHLVLRFIGHRQNTASFLAGQPPIPNSPILDPQRLPTDLAHLPIRNLKQLHGYKHPNLPWKDFTGTPRKSKGRVKVVQSKRGKALVAKAGGKKVGKAGGKKDKGPDASSSKQPVDSGKKGSGKKGSGKKGGGKKGAGKKSSGKKDGGTDASASTPKPGDGGPGASGSTPKPGDGGKSKGKGKADVLRLKQPKVLHPSTPRKVQLKADSPDPLTPTQAKGKGKLIQVQRVKKTVGKKDDSDDDLL